MLPDNSIRIGSVRTFLHALLHVYLLDVSEHRRQTYLNVIRVGNGPLVPTQRPAGQRIFATDFATQSMMLVLMYLTSGISRRFVACLINFYRNGLLSGVSAPQGRMGNWACPPPTILDPRGSVLGDFEPKPKAPK